MLTIYTDGASRSNPGQAAAGVMILRGNEIIYEKGFYLGEMSNNQAEYNALIHALEIAKLHGGKADCYSDSQLMVRQLNGEYRVKNEDLIELYKKIKALEKNFESVTYTHVKRSHKGIKKVDKLANMALDERNGRH